MPALHRLALLLVMPLLCATPALADSGAFWAHWSDGQAELSGYTLDQPRYGEMRKGHAVLVFVTEPFSRSRGVKVDRYDAQNPDHFTALKLNHVRTFQTGLYPYRLMTSVFTDPAQGLAPVKIVFSSQEWCGQLYEEARFGPDGAALKVASYFEGESGTHAVPVTVAEDALFVTARGLMAGGPGKAPSGPVSMLASAQNRRLTHRPAQATKTTFDWGPSRSVSVPAGAFTVRTLKWDRGGIGCAMDVEVAAPHRIVGWRCDDGEKAELTGTMRSPYWQQARNGDASVRARLGLPVSATGL